MTEQQEQAAPVDWQAIAERRERELKTVGNARHHAEAAIERVRRVARYARARTAAGESDWAIGQHELAVAVLDTLTEPAPTPDTATTEATDPAARYAQAIARVESSGPKPAPAGPATITDPAYLRAQYAAAIERYFTTDWDPTVRTEDGYTRLAAAVHRVRDRHVEQLRQRLALASGRHLAVDAWQSAYDRANTAEQQRDQLAGIVRDLYDNSPCSSDHHGHCQTHGNLSETRCPHDRAREILAQLDKPKEQ